MTNWFETLRLIDKTKTLVTPITINGDSTGNLLPWKVKVSTTHTGIKKTNGGTVVLRIDNLGTFVRNNPILNDQNTKFNYLVEYQKFQDVTNTGTYIPGRLFRMEIRNANIELVEGIGECLNLTCIEQQYRLKEAHDAFNDYSLTPRGEISSRINHFFTSYPNVLFLNDTTTNPAAFNMASPSLKNNWLPLAPTAYHDLFSEVIRVLSQPPSAGGTLTDYFFDFNPSTNVTKTLDFFYDIYGRQSSGVTISPTSTQTAAAQISQSNTLSNQNFKNQVILKGNATSGSLPMETVKFNSAFNHAEGYDGIGGRDIWSSSSVNYNIGDIVKRVLTISNGTDNYNINRYFTCILANTSSGANDPITDNSHWFEDFTIIAEWKPFAHYYAGDIVTVTDNGVGNVKFFIAKIDMTVSSVPTIDTNWLSIWSTKLTSLYKPFYSYTPWTSDRNDFLTNLAGFPFDSTAIPIINPISNHYLGYFVDWNYTTANYDPRTKRNEFSYLTMKAVTYYQNSIPSDPNEIFEGQRILVKSPGSGTFAGHENRIAQWDNTISDWQYSDAPTTGDVISVFHDALYYKWNGSAWIPIGLTSTNTTAFHPVSDLYLTKGASGIAAQAIEARFNWTSPTIWGFLGLNAIGAPYNFDDLFNQLSRGLWLNFWFPYPRFKTNSNLAVGHNYGQNIGTSTALGTLNTFNLDGDRHGLSGWNQGSNSEDMGRITGVHFKLKPSFFRVDRSNGNGGKTSTKDGILSQGYDNQTFQFWAVDMFDRVFYQEFQCRVNGSFETIDIQFGSNAQQLLYFNRIQELQIAGGFTSPWNFFLKEKEFTGVAFDWRFVKGCGWQWKGANDETNQYKLMIEQTLAETVNSILQIFNGSVLGQGLSGTNQNVECDYATIALDEFYFIKELYVNSTDSILNDPRATVEYDDSEPDYYNAKAKAQAMALRSQYYPLFTTYQVNGDVRIKFGQTFNVSGTRVNGGTDTFVCSEVTDETDRTGYHMTITGVKKFVLPILSSNPVFGTTTTSFNISGSSYSKSITNNILYIDGSFNSSSIASDGSGNISFVLPGSVIGIGFHTITVIDGVTGISATVVIQVTS